MCYYSRSMKIKIVHKQISSFNTPWMRSIVDQYFDFEFWDPSKTYAPGTVFYLNCMDFPAGYNQLAATPLELVERGFRVIVDNLWEIDSGPFEYCYTVKNPAWFWYNESLWYQHLGYDQYTPVRGMEYLGLMPMRLRKPHRDQLLSAVDPVLDQLLWSYVACGRQLPRDQDISLWSTQRYFDPLWYDQSYISVVAETGVSGSVFITEKTMKPLAFQHPFIVYGNSGTLGVLRSWGFETFDNLWDESYDMIEDSALRCDAIAAILKEITVRALDSETLRRLQHNRDHFFDRALVIDKIQKEIIEPIIEYAET